MKQPFWRRKSLDEMTDREWESLCDGCAKCCLHKLEDEDTGEVFFTRVACKLLDITGCRCMHYAERTRRVSDCLDMRKTRYRREWLPSTCAYRLLAEGQDLPDWHPLRSKRPESVHRAGISVRDFAIPETPDIDPADHVMEDLI